MANRMTKWLLFTVLFAFIPMIIAFLISFMTNTQINTYNYNGEILFFIIMISATSLCDIIDLTKEISNFILTFFMAIFIMLVIFSAVIYGSVIYEKTALLSTQISQDKIFAVSCIMASISFILGTIIQISLGLKEVKK